MATQEDRKVLVNLVRGAESRKEAEEMLHLFSDIALTADEFEALWAEKEGLPVESVPIGLEPEVKREDIPEVEEISVSESEKTAEEMFREIEEINREARKRQEEKRKRQPKPKTDWSELTEQERRRIRRAKRTKQHPEEKGLYEAGEMLEEEFKPTPEMKMLQAEIDGIRLAAEEKLGRVQKYKNPDARAFKALEELKNLFVRLAMLREQYRDAERKAREEFERKKADARSALLKANSSSLFRIIPLTRAAEEAPVWNAPATIQETSNSKKTLRNREFSSRIARIAKENRRRISLRWKGSRNRTLLFFILDCAVRSQNAMGPSKEEFRVREEAAKRLRKMSKTEFLEELDNLFSGEEITEEEYLFILNLLSLK